MRLYKFSFMLSLYVFPSIRGDYLSKEDSSNVAKEYKQKNCDRIEYHEMTRVSTNSSLSYKNHEPACNFK